MSHRSWFSLLNQNRSNLNRHGPQKLRGGGDGDINRGPWESSWNGVEGQAITMTIWLYWDFGSLEARSKPLALCHVLWAITDWCLWSGGAHHAEEGQTNGDGGPAFDSVRSTWSTIKVARLVKVNHNYEVCIMVSSYTESWKVCFHWLYQGSWWKVWLSVHMDLWLSLVWT